MGYYSRIEASESHMTVARSSVDREAIAKQVEEMKAALVQLKEMGLTDAVKEMEIRIHSMEQAASGSTVLSETEQETIQKALDKGSLSHLGFQVDTGGVVIDYGDSGKFYGPKEDLQAMIDAVPGLVYNGVVTVSGEDSDGLYRIRIENNKIIFQKPVITWVDEQ